MLGVKTKLCAKPSVSCECVETRSTDMEKEIEMAGNRLPTPSLPGIVKSEAQAIWRLGHLSGALRFLSKFSYLCNSRPEHAQHASAGCMTWLILPVVICLSQRLSHACFSISFGETANGSLKQL